MSNEVVSQQAQAAPAKPKLSWGEKRDRRRRRRKLFEEALGWLLVPALLYGAYLAFQAVGGIPRELQDFGMEVFAMLMGSRSAGN